MSQSLFFIDIETVPIQEHFHGYAEALFKKKFQSVFNDGKFIWDEIWHNQAGLYAEFGKIICISMGREHEGKFKIKSIAGPSEKAILEAAGEVFKKATKLCGHNIKDFDAPFLMRRYLANGLPIPEILNVMGKKPWEVQIDDTMEMWGGSQWKYRVSLDLLCHTLGIQSPKQDIQGSDIARIYYESLLPEEGVLPFEKQDAAIKQISTYCNGDILATAQCYYKMKGMEFKPEIEYV